jgi:hypothetical protein
MHDIFLLSKVSADKQVTFVTIAGVEVTGYVNRIDENTGMIQLNSSPPPGNKRLNTVTRLSSNHITHWYTVETN